MRLSKHDREAKAAHYWLRRPPGFSKLRVEASTRNHVTDERSRHASADLVLDNRPRSNHEDSSMIRSLWDRAYDALRDDETSLVNKYDELLLKEAQRTGAHRLHVIP